MKHKERCVPCGLWSDLVDELQTEKEKLKEMLWEMEYPSWNNHFEDNCCHFCGRPRYDGHKPDCKLDAELNPKPEKCPDCIDGLVKMRRVDRVIGLHRCLVCNGTGWKGGE